MDRAGSGDLGGWLHPSSGIRMVGKVPAGVTWELPGPGLELMTSGKIVKGGDLGLQLVSHWPGHQLSLLRHPSHSQGTEEWLWVKVEVRCRWVEPGPSPLAPVKHIPHL